MAALSSNSPLSSVTVELGKTMPATCLFCGQPAAHMERKSFVNAEDQRSAAVARGLFGLLFGWMFSSASTRSVDIALPVCMNHRGRQPGAANVSLRGATLTNVSKQFADHYAQVNGLATENFFRGLKEKQ